MTFGAKYSNLVNIFEIKNCNFQPDLKIVIQITNDGTPCKIPNYADFVSWM